ncbi:unnamed protein product [Brachionus calyciflorus]|uniref:Uncharacterized protein n=1 Tax=Brachionus calyciflorus TaxID=104777 RepID=A0A813XVC6_9BILA|nr:unnamed protein product [Brachionus calyciflorus]
MNSKFVLRGRSLEKSSEIIKNPNCKEKTSIALKLKEIGPITDGQPAKNILQLKLPFTERRKLVEFLRDILDFIEKSNFKEKICAAYGTLLGLVLKNEIMKHDDELTFLLIRKILKASLSFGKI